jgi:hypothetical protein
MGCLPTTALCTPRGKGFAQGAVLVVDSDRGQIGWVGAVGVEEIANTGAFAKYALIDWGRDREFNFLVEEKRSDDPNSTAILNKFRPHYLTSQILVGYKWCLCGRETKVFAAYLYNHDAKAVPRRTEI